MPKSTAKALALTGQPRSKSTRQEAVMRNEWH
jgi:hypothetical protein